MFAEFPQPTMHLSHERLFQEENIPFFLHYQNRSKFCFFRFSKYSFALESFLNQQLFRTFISKWCTTFCFSEKNCVFSLQSIIGMYLNR
jgi:hypothetical protein